MNIRAGLTCCCLIAGAGEALGQSPPSAVATHVDRILTAQIAAHRASAAALVVVDAHGIVYARGYGDESPGVPVDPAVTTFRAASVSKLFVATAATQLADAGRLDLNADIRRYLPDLGIRSSYGTPITTAQLLTHTSGIADSLLHALARTPADLLPLREYFRRFPPEVVHEPGTSVAYSNLGMALAGAVVEAVTGERFDSYVEREILLPLGMARSTFRQPVTPAIGQGMEGHTSPRQPPLIRPYPAGSLVTTATDMGRYLIAELAGGQIEGRGVLRPAGVALMQAHHFGDPRVQGVAYGFFESRLRGEHALFHTGDSGHHSLLWMLPERGVGLYAVYATRDEGALEMREELVEGALDALGAKEPAPPAQPPPAALTAYNGWYVLGAHPPRTFEALMGLVAQVHVTAIDGRTLRIKPPAGGAPISASRVGDDLFTTSDGGSIAFQRDPAGHPSGFTLVGSIWDPQGLHRAGLRDAQPLTLAIVAIALVCLIARVAIGLVLLGRRHSRPEIRAASVVARIGWRASGALPWILLLVPITAVAGMLISRPPYYELPRGVSLAFGILTMGAAVGAALPVAAIAAWHHGSWTAARRCFFSIYAASMLALAWTLVHWSVVP